MRMRVWAMTGLGLLGGCGGGGTTGTNYSDPPPMAEIVASPSPRASETAAPVAAPAPADTSNAAEPEPEPVAENAVD